MIIVFSPATGARAELTFLGGTGARTTWRWSVAYRGRQVLDGQCDTEHRAAGALAEATTQAATTPTLNDRARDAIRALVSEL